MSDRRLVLFDIDGTILRGGRLWAECFLSAFKEACAVEELRKIPFSGKTDRQICRELMQACGLWPQHEGRIDRVLRGYLDRVRAGVPARAHEVQVMPGVRELIAELRTRHPVVVGLLTGNVREGAYLKLETVGLHEAFRFGVFGDDHWDRYQLPAIAIERARSQLGLEFGGKQVVIIGDTIHDIGCGQSVGARAIGVGTGQADQRERVLASWLGHPEAVAAGDPRPDHFFEDLSDTAAVLDAILK